MRVIKKYPNRRLYDTELGTYITLEDIKELVFNHVEFQVIDTQTKKDITQFTLLQIIMEQETTDSPIFTTSMLQNFIRFYHEKTQTLLRQYLEQSMDLFLQQRQFFKNQFQSYQSFVSDPSFVEYFTKMSSLWPGNKSATFQQEMKKEKTPAED